MGLLKSKIVVAPMGEIEFPMITRLAAEIGPVFNRSVDILKGMKMPTSTTPWSYSPNWKEQNPTPAKK